MSSLHSQAAVSPGVLLPLPPEGHRLPINISLVRWLELPIDQRAPERSVALVDFQGVHFIAFIVDVVAGRLLWRITAASDALRSLYAGMRGESLDHARGTLVVSVPPRSPPQGIDTIDPTTSDSGGRSVRSPGGPGGSPGDPPPP